MTATVRSLVPRAAQASVTWPQRLRRFMASGLVAFGAQLGALVALTALGIPALWANLIAIFCGSQVNFVLSAHLTWADRPASFSPKGGRWARFTATLSVTNVLNEGLFLLAQRVAPVVIAAAIGSLCAAILNFLAGDRLVFGRPARRASAMNDSVKECSCLPE